MRLLIEKGYDSISINVTFDCYEYSVHGRCADLCFYEDSEDSQCTVNIDVSEKELDMLKELICKADRLMYEEQKRLKE